METKIIATGLFISILLALPIAYAQTVTLEIPENEPDQIVIHHFLSDIDVSNHSIIDVNKICFHDGICINSTLNITGLMNFSFDKTNIAYKNQTNTFSQYNSFLDGFNASIDCSNITGSASNLCTLLDTAFNASYESTFNSTYDLKNTSIWIDNGTFLEPRTDQGVSGRVFIPAQLRIKSILSTNFLNIGYDTVSLYFNQSSTGGTLQFMNNANNPQILGGATNMTGTFFIDSSGTSRPLALNTLGANRPIELGGNTTADNNMTVLGKLFVGTGSTGIYNMSVYTPTIDIASVSALSTSEQNFTVNGLTTFDTVYGNKPSHTSGCVIGNLRVPVNNTLSITIGNVLSVLGCDPPSEMWRIVAVRS